MAGKQCCENPPTLGSGSGVGHVKELGGLSSYITGSADSKFAVVLISDVFGYEAPNLRKLADKVAVAGFYTVVPDFFGGDPYVPENVERPIFVWLKDHEADQGFEDAKLVIEALKSSGITKIAAAGFCWGAKVVVELAKHSYIQSGVLLHPSLVTVEDIQAARIFSGSHEFEWHHQATWSITDVGINSFCGLKSSSNFIIEAAKAVCRPVVSARKMNQQSRELAGTARQASRGDWDAKRMPTRMWASSEVPLIPYGQLVFNSRNVSNMLYWLQLASATACVVLSLMKLVHRNYGEVEKGDSDKRNRKSALIIFYSLALADASLFLLEKAYWEWKVSVQKILDQVNKECELGESGSISIKRFFYDAYSRCVNGSIFDGLKMDITSFAMELLES